VIDVDEAADAIYDTGGFGESVTFTGGITVNAIFTPATEGTIGLRGRGRGGERHADVPDVSEITAVKPRHTVVVRSVTYTVIKIEDVGTGDSVVQLKT
jgi:hypothetical protein